ncbi:MAG: glycosyltransferase family 1 protein [FCB group bacterium]|nr:glycosyltransferase family 1 protein [FCB group bacterium]
MVSQAPEVLSRKKKAVSILGTRGIPAGHGGFETLAEHLALYLADKGWSVTVYCQQDGRGGIYEDVWKGIRRVHIPVISHRSIHTILFDLKSIIHASRENSVKLTLGYGTSIFWLLFKLKKNMNVCNMDGVEWRRKKWSFLQRLWLRFNEKSASLLSNHLIADCPEIERYLLERVPRGKLTMIPYGAFHVTDADEQIIKNWGLQKNNYILTICRIEEDNSLLEIIMAFNQKPRAEKLVIVGGIDFERERYHWKLRTVANDSTVFLGPVYEEAKVNALRHFAKLYVHGHTVGGTNPSLVEAMGAELPVLARNNPYNRWVAGPENHYFDSVLDCSREFDVLLASPDLLQSMAEASTKRFQQRFRWEMILGEYERVLHKFTGEMEPIK